MSVELVSKKSKSKIGVIVLMVIQSFILLRLFTEFNKDDLVSSFMGIGVNILMLGGWFFLFTKVKNNVGLHISFNQKYLIIENDKLKREIDMENVISIEKSWLVINNQNTCTITYRTENKKVEQLNIQVVQHQESFRIA